MKLIIKKKKKIKTYLISLFLLNIPGNQYELGSNSLIIIFETT